METNNMRYTSECEMCFFIVGITDQNFIMLKDNWLVWIMHKTASEF